MCWNSETSGAFTALGVASAGAVWRLTGNRDMTKAILFFCLMELLQSVQYFFIAEDLLDAKCADAANQVLTVLGYVHIQFQPYFTNLYLRAFRPSTGKAAPGEAKLWDLVSRLCLAQCALGLARLALSPSLLDRAALTATEEAFYGASRDWLEGPRLCTYKGSFHLAWALPLAQPTYFLGGMGLHAFMMFAPALCIGGLSELDAVAFLVASGPALAMALTANAHEQASIWCFFSTTQCAVGATSAVLQHRAAARAAPAPERASK